MAQKKKTDKNSLPIKGKSIPSIKSGSEENVENENKYFDVTKNKWLNKYRKNGKLTNDYYLHELMHHQEELVKLQYWVKEKGLRVAILFEGRDAAGKGGGC